MPGILQETILGYRLDQQKDVPNWEDFLTVIAESFQEVVDVLVSLSSETWKDTAAGVWLDRVGEIVGVLRPFDEETDNIFTVTEVGDTTPSALMGFGEVSDPAQGGYVWDLYGLSKGVNANDPDYLDFIDAKIFATNADASIPGLARYMKNAFGLDVTVARPQVGQITITLPATGYDLRQRRYMELMCPAIGGIDVLFIGWPEV